MSFLGCLEDFLYLDLCEWFHPEVKGVGCIILPL